MTTPESLLAAIDKLDAEINSIEQELQRLKTVREDLLRSFKKVCPHTNCKMIDDDECVCLDCGTKV